MKMTASQSLKIYELLNEQFKQPEKARQLTEAIEAVIDERVQTSNQQFESSFKKDLEPLKTDVVGNLHTEMRDQKVDMIKWFAGLFITLALLIFGLYLKISTIGQ